MALNDDILSRAIAHEIGIQRLTNATVRKVIALLNRVDARIVERLAEAGGSDLSRARQERILEEVRAIVNSVYTDATGQLQIDLEDFAKYEAEFQADLFKATIPVDLDYVRPTSQQIIAAVNSRPFQGKLLKDWFTGLPAEAFARLRNSIRMGFVEGRTIDQMVREVRGTRVQGFKDGILETNRRAAEATVRTAVAHTANAGRDTFYKANKRLLKGLQWTSTLDLRTSAVCRGRDGQIYPVDTGPRPPAHINCRSSMVPVVKSWRELGLKDIDGATRASMNGQVPAETNYDAWLRQQPIEVQDDVLGASRAQLFRAGLTQDRFVSRAGDEYTLDELRKREGATWAKVFG